MYMYICIYVYIYICVCVCMAGDRKCHTSPSHGAGAPADVQDEGNADHGEGHACEDRDQDIRVKDRRHTFPKDSVGPHHG